MTSGEPVQDPGWASCKDCNGDGQIGMYRDGTPMTCPACKGKGAWRITTEES